MQISVWLWLDLWWEFRQQFLIMMTNSMPVMSMVLSHQNDFDRWEWRCDAVDSFSLDFYLDFFVLRSAVASPAPYVVVSSDFFPSGAVLV